MPHAIPPLQASAQGDPAPIAASSKTPRRVSHQKLAHLAHLREIKLDFQPFSHAQTCASCAPEKITRKNHLAHLAHLAAFPFLRSNSHVFEFSTSGHLIVHLAACSPFWPPSAATDDFLFSLFSSSLLSARSVVKNLSCLARTHVSHFSLSRPKQQSAPKRQQSASQRQQSAPEKQQSVPQQIVVQNRKNLSPFPKNLISSQPEGVPLPPTDQKPRYFYF
jgi:hypothetical protein